jgi:hypothetical protein
MIRLTFWVTVVVGAVAVAFAWTSLGQIALGCDYGPIGIGRPVCEAHLADSWITLAVSSGVLVLCVVVALVTYRRAKGRVRQ